MTAPRCIGEESLTTPESVRSDSPTTTETEEGTGVARYLEREALGESERGAVEDIDGGVDNGITCGCFGRPTRVPRSTEGSVEPAKPALVRPEPKSRTIG